MQPPGIPVIPASPDFAACFANFDDALATHIGRRGDRMCGTEAIRIYS